MLGWNIPLRGLSLWPIPQPATRGRSNGVWHSWEILVSFWWSFWSRPYLMLHAHHTLWAAGSISTGGSGCEGGIWGVGCQWRGELLLQLGVRSRQSSFLSGCFRECWRDKYVMNMIRFCKEKKLNKQMLQQIVFNFKKNSQLQFQL